ncbi:MAG TPA: hypothetical protein VMV01_10700, partial [Planctomycetota bacterium]|nr:hypothetical protein [Planctomycetota bacterium]
MAFEAQPRDELLLRPRAREPDLGLADADELQPLDAARRQVESRRPPFGRLDERPRQGTARLAVDRAAERHALARAERLTLDRTRRDEELPGHEVVQHLDRPVGARGRAEAELEAEA